MLWVGMRGCLRRVSKVHWRRYNMSTISDVRQALKTYIDCYRRPDLPPLELSQLYDLGTGSEIPPEDIGSKWPDPWPNGWSKGVYFIFGSSGSLLYVGKASLNQGIGSRLGAWFQYENDEARSCKVVHPNWSESPRYVMTLPVTDEMSFEAPALEEYFIRTLHPTDNTIGRQGDTGANTSISP